MKRALFILAFLPFIVNAQPWLKFYSPDWEYKVLASFNPDYDQGCILSVSVADYIPQHNQHNLFCKLDDNGSSMTD